jgi:hypothetical protein
MNSELLLKCEDDMWRAFAGAFETVSPDRRQLEGVVPGWSTHDVVWHCVFWADYAGEMLDRIRAGDPDPDDFEGPEDEILAAGRALSWDEVLRRAEQARSKVRAALTNFADAPTRAVEWFQDDTFDHYEEHAAQIEAFAREPRDS